ncbi:hypothetical protein ACW9KT_19715 [Hymenobacter sp. HD11105]
MNFDAQRLYELLPALYRLRDAQAALPEEEGPLKALVTLLAEQIGVLEENLDQLYDDQFIETCAEWVVPYLGDLVGARGVVVFPEADFSARSQVANTLSYRRRKGTAAVLEQLARDVTGWDASVVEYFQLLATTQYLNHLRPENLAVAPLGQAQLLEELHSPFDKITRTVDVRRIEPRRGKYNLPNIGIYLWRLESHPISYSPAYRVDDLRFTFSALGLSMPLYNRPVPEPEITHLAEPRNVPRPLGRAELKRNLAWYYGADESKSLAVWVEVERVEGVEEQLVAPDAIAICDLSNVKDLTGHDVLDAAGEPVGWMNVPAAGSAFPVALDPVLGRIAFQLHPAQPPPRRVQVSYQYGFSARMGGGEYGRASTFAPALGPVITVSKTNGVTLQSAFNLLAATGGVVEIQDNDYYLETPVVRIAAGKIIELRAADQKRPMLVLASAMRVTGGANAEFIVNGLLVSGGTVQVPLLASSGTPNRLRALRVRHCTLLPGASPAVTTAAGSVPVGPATPRLVVEVPGCEVEVAHSISGPLRVTDEAAVDIRNCIVDALQPTEVAFAGLVGSLPATNFEVAKPGGTLTVHNSTVIGKVHTTTLLLASNTIFLAGLGSADQWPAAVLANRLQYGCVRYCYVPPGSRVPAPYRCQPATDALAARVRPIFTSLLYGHPGYGQLSAACSLEISQGADDEAEMGAFHNLYQPQREANLRARLEEYLRFGLEAGIYRAS